MASPDLKRKLTAILSADVKGYSRLMGEDEEWTVRTLDTFKGVMKTIIPQHRGRVVDSTGDNLLAEFASVVDAVQAAVEIQQVLRAKNSLLPESRRMEFRIGINLGDVIEEGERIFGDGVNIAARLEGMAEAGGICISGSAFEQIENKLPLHYDYLGEHEVKNITRPVRVYRALMDNGVVEGEGHRVQGEGFRAQALGRWPGCRAGRTRGGCGMAFFLAPRPAASARGFQARREGRPPEDGLPPAGQTVDRRAAIRQHERRSQAGVLQRRHHRGDHHRAFEDPAVLRYRPELHVHLQRKAR